MLVCSPTLAGGTAPPLRKPADANHTLLAVEMPQGMAPSADWGPWIQMMGLGDLKMARGAENPDALDFARWLRSQAESAGNNLLQ